MSFRASTLRKSLNFTHFVAVLTIDHSLGDLAMTIDDVANSDDLDFREIHRAMRSPRPCPPIPIPAVIRSLAAFDPFESESLAQMMVGTPATAASPAVRFKNEQSRVNGSIHVWFSLLIGAFEEDIPQIDVSANYLMGSTTTLSVGKLSGNGVRHSPVASHSTERIRTVLNPTHSRGVLSPTCAMRLVRHLPLPSVPKRQSAHSYLFRYDRERDRSKQ